MHKTISNAGYVYFVQAETGGPIKIGSANNVKRRLKQLQTGNPELLVLLHSTTGGKRLERSLQESFKKYNKRDEWFFPDDSIVEFIYEIKFEDDEFGYIQSLRDFINEKSYNINKNKIELMEHLLNGSILSNHTFEEKLEYWTIMDDYLEYLKSFPDWMVHKRLLNTFINEGRQTKDLSFRKQHEIIIRNF